MASQVTFRSRTQTRVRALSQVFGVPLVFWVYESGTHLLIAVNEIDFSVFVERDDPVTTGVGVGGNLNTVWHTEPQVAELIYELAPITFAVIRSASTPGNGTGGVGGTNNTIWASRGVGPGSALIYELSTSDFSVVRSAAAPGQTEDTNDIGGGDNKIWEVQGELGSGDEKLYELSTVDFSVVFSLVPVAATSGGGGSDSRFFSVRLRAGAETFRPLVEHNIDTFAEIQTVEWRSNFISRVGGTQ